MGIRAHSSCGVRTVSLGLSAVSQLAHLADRQMQRLCLTRAAPRQSARRVLRFRSRRPGRFRAAHMQLAPEAIPGRWRPRSRTRPMFRPNPRPPAPGHASGSGRGLNAAPAAGRRGGVQTARAGDALSVELAQQMLIFVAFLYRRIGLAYIAACTPLQFLGLLPRTRP